MNILYNFDIKLKMFENDEKHFLVNTNEKSCRCNDIAASVIVIAIIFAIIITVIVVLFTSANYPRIDFTIENVTNITATNATVQIMAKKNETYQLQMVYLRKGDANNTIYNYNPNIGQYFNIKLNYLMPDTKYFIYILDITHGHKTVASDDFYFRTCKNESFCF